MILDGEHDDFGAEKLKGLMKILPEMVRHSDFREWKPNPFVSVILSTFLDFYLLQMHCEKFCAKHCNVYIGTYVVFLTLHPGGRLACNL
jgi:hypothetical protein